MFLILITWMICGIIAAAVADSRGASGGWYFLFGIVFGPVAIVFAIMSGNLCPMCQKRISTRAALCPYCRTQLAANKPRIISPGFHIAPILAGLFVLIIALYTMNPNTDSPQEEVITPIQKLENKTFDVKDGSVCAIDPQQFVPMANAINNGNTAILSSLALKGKILFLYAPTRVEKLEETMLGERVKIKIRDGPFRSKVCDLYIDNRTNQ